MWVKDSELSNYCARGSSSLDFCISKMYTIGKSTLIFIFLRKLLNIRYVCPRITRCKFHETKLYKTIGDLTDRSVL